MSNQGWIETLVSQKESGPTLASAAAASALAPHAKFTLPANFFNYIGKTLRIKAFGQVSTAVTTPGTFRLDHRLGGTVVADSQAVALDTVNAHSAVGWVYEAMLCARIIGNVAQLWYQATLQTEIVKGFGTAPAGVLTAILPWQATPALGTAFDATASQQLDMFFTQTVATGSFILQGYTVESMN